MAENELTPATVSGLQIAWSAPAGSFGRPTVSNGLVYVANSSHVSALDADTGVIRWQTSTSDAVLGSVVVSEGSAFYGDYLGGFHALDPATGVERWRYQSAGILTLSPVADNGIVVLAEDDIAVFTGLNATTGAVLWHQTANLEPIGADPVIANGVAYLAGGQGTILAVNLANGSIVWQRQASGGVMNLAFAGGHLVARLLPHATASFDAATGALQWETQHAAGGNPFFSVAAGKVFASVTLAGLVEALDLETGGRVWTASWGGVPLGNSFAGGVLYVGDVSDASLYALDPSSGAILGHVSVPTANLKDGPSIANGFVYLAATVALSVPGG